MSERLTRRQMRELGLLKPKQAPERRDIPDDEANPAPVAPDAAEDDRTVATPDSAASPESTRAFDAAEARTAESEEPVEAGDARSADSFEAPGSAEEPESTEAPESAEAPGRTSVFDRFEPSSDAEKRSAGAALGAGVVPPARLADSEAEELDEVEDYSQWLRSRMNEDNAGEETLAAPSADSASTAGRRRRSRRAVAESPAATALAEPADAEGPAVVSSAEATDDHVSADDHRLVDDHAIDDHDEDETAPERPGALRTFLGFVILILLGLGIGILLGQLIFGGGDSEGAPAHSFDHLTPPTSISGVS